MTTDPDSTATSPSGTASATAPPPFRWAALWPLPTILAAGIGVWLALDWGKTAAPQDDFPSALTQVDELLARGETAAARSILTEVVAPRLLAAPAEINARYNATLGDALIAEHRTQAPPREIDEAIIGHYAAAEHAGWTLSPTQFESRAEVLVRLGRPDEAFASLATSADREGASKLRRTVRRSALEGLLARTGSSPTSLLAAIDEYRADAVITAEDEAWAVMRAAEIRLSVNDVIVALDRLLLDIRRLETAPEGIEAKTFAALSNLLGECYRRQARFDDALVQFEHAQSLAPAGSLEAGESALGIGRSAHELGNLEHARDAFSLVVGGSHNDRVMSAALFGRAKAFAAEPDHEASLGDFTILRTRFHQSKHGALNGAEVIDTIIAIADAELLSDAPGNALAYALIASDLLPGVAPTSPVLLRLASSSRAEADRLRASAEGGDPGKLPPNDRIRVNRLLKNAADWFLAHGRHPATIALADGSASASLWAAADSFDLGGWRENAVEGFSAFLRSVQEGDLKRAEAEWRLAGILHAEGDFEAAAQHYESAIAVAPNGPFAVQSIVPLARALHAGGRTADAAVKLGSVLDGSFGLEPAADEYWDSLDVLSLLMARKGDHARAVELLREALARRPDAPRAGELEFRQGESLRELAKSIRATTTAQLPPSKVEEVREQIATLFTESESAYQRAIIAFDLIAPALRDGLATDMLREAHLHRADSVYELARYEDAIELYEVVDRKYSDHAVSMVALIQIVNSCDLLQDAERAITAHRRAELRLAQLSDDAFLANGGILSREAWDRWLRNHPPAPRAIATGETPPPTEGSGG